MTSLLYLPHIYTHSVLFSLTANFPFSHLPPASLQISVLSSNITVYGRWLHRCPSTQQPAVGLHAEKEWESPLFLTQLQQLDPIWALHITLVPGNKYVQICSSGILSLSKLVTNNLVHTTQVPTHPLHSCPPLHQSSVFPDSLTVLHPSQHVFFTR